MRSSSPVRRIALVVAIVALTVPAIASAVGAAVDGRTRAQSGSSDGEALATLSVTTDNVLVRKDGKKKFNPAEDGQALEEGDTVKTDATGTAEIDYGDDAFTRLDVSTTFTIVVLTDEQGARQVQGSLESGQTWNRTAALTESGSFEQEGAGANATVRGTAFAITCDTVDHCNFQAVVDDIDLTGVDGITRQLTPLTQCESSDSAADGSGDLTGVLCDETTPIPPDQLPQWILTNLFADLLLGLDDGGILTGTIVVDEQAGTATFVPGPAPAPSGGGSTPTPTPGCGSESAATVYDGSPGDGPPPATLGTCEMTAFGPDDRADFTDVSSVAAPGGGVVAFSTPLNKRSVEPVTEEVAPAAGWSTWSHEYVGPVYFLDGSGGPVTITLPAGTLAFSFYAEPNQFDIFSVTATANDGTTSGAIPVNGSSGATYFGFYATSSSTPILSVAVSSTDTSGFAIGEFRISHDPAIVASTSTPTATSTEAAGPAPPEPEPETDPAPEPDTSDTEPAPSE